jgi:hypothetical protein
VDQIAAHQSDDEPIVSNDLRIPPAQLASNIPSSWDNNCQDEIGDDEKKEVEIGKSANGANDRKVRQL